MHNIGSRLIPSPAAANFFPQMKFEAEEIEPPKFHMDPQLLLGADFKRAAENDVARVRKCAAKRPHPSTGQLIFAQMGPIVAGELAGAWRSLGGIGPQRMTLAQVALRGLAQNQGTGARALEAQNSDWQQLARDRRGVTKVARQPSEPRKPTVIGVISDQRQDSEARISDSRNGAKRGGEPLKRRETGGLQLGTA